MERRAQMGSTVLRKSRQAVILDGVLVTYRHLCPQPNAELEYLAAMLAPGAGSAAKPGRPTTGSGEGNKQSN